MGDFFMLVGLVGGLWGFFRGPEFYAHHFARRESFFHGIQHLMECEGRRYCEDFWEDRPDPYRPKKVGTKVTGSLYEVIFESKKTAGERAKEWATLLHGWVWRALLGRRTSGH